MPVFAADCSSIRGVVEYIGRVQHYIGGGDVLMNIIHDGSGVEHLRGTRYLPTLLAAELQKQTQLGCYNPLVECMNHSHPKHLGWWKILLGVIREYAFGRGKAKKIYRVLENDRIRLPDTQVSGQHYRVEYVP